MKKLLIPLALFNFALFGNDSLFDELDEHTSKISKHCPKGQGKIKYVNGVETIECNVSNKRSSSSAQQPDFSNIQVTVYEGRTSGNFNLTKEEREKCLSSNNYNLCARKTKALKRAKYIRKNGKKVTKNKDSEIVKLTIELFKENYPDGQKDIAIKEYRECINNNPHPSQNIICVRKARAFIAENFPKIQDSCKKELEGKREGICNGYTWVRKEGHINVISRFGDDEKDSLKRQKHGISEASQEDTFAR